MLNPPNRQEYNIWQFCVIFPEAKIGIISNATILPGITIGENAMVGTGSVVTKDVPAGELWIGNPAKNIERNNMLNLINRGLFRCPTIPKSLRV